jgi:hypothetical protein
MFPYFQKPIGGQVSDRDARDRRRHHHHAEPDEPNPDFDFGTQPSSASVAQPSLTDRVVSSYLLLVLFFVFVLPFSILLIGFAIAFVRSLF